MKKFLLIPLMTMLCSVMAWGTTRTASTFEELLSATSSAVDGDVIQLTGDIVLDYSDIETEYPLNNIDGIIKVTKDITLDLNSHNITTNEWGWLHDELSAINIFDGGKLTVIGDGQIVVGDYYELCQMFNNDDEMTYSAVFGIEVDNNYDAAGQLVLRGGSYDANPSENYNFSDWFGWRLEEGVDVETVSIQGGYGPYDIYKLTYSDNSPASLLRDYLTGESSELYTITGDIELSSGGVINISGTKTLSINEGVTVAFKNNSPAIVVPNGATLNLKGKGSLSFVRDIIKVEEGGTLIIGDANSTDALTITSSFSDDETKYYAIDNYGTTNIYRANITSRKNALQNHASGKMIVKNARIIGQASSSDLGLNQHAYAVINSGTMVLADTYVQGIHGAVACQSGNGTLELHNCDLRALNNPEKTDAYYALYVCTKAMVSAYNTKFYSENANQTIYIGNNDAYNTFGLIYLYDGCKSNRKMYVQKKKETDETILFPVLVSEGSAWYTVAMNGGEGPLPANCNYSDIDETIDGLTYLFAVVDNTPAEQKKEIDSNEATIPWQQNTTWDADWEEGDAEVVPQEAAVVTIPEGKEVVVSNDPDVTGTGEDKDTVAVAKQIFIGDGAKLTVQTGTILNVGVGGVNIANGGQLVVQPGAVVTVATSGLVTTEDEALVIEATEEDQGVFLLQPDVKENTQPKATVKLVTKCKQINASEYLWERFAIPTKDGEQTTFSIEGGTAGIETYGGVAFNQGLYGWSDEQQDWVGLDRFKDMEPFKGYQLSNNSLNGNVTYVFEGNLVGNADQAYEFAQTGFGFFGNSYTGDIDILKFFETFGENMQKTIWIYDYYTDGFKAITEDNYGSIYYGTRKARHGTITDIRSMQAFLMNAFEEGDPTAINYAAAIWGNPKYGLVQEQNNGGAPKRVAVNEDRFTVYVAGEKQEDEVSFIRSNEYSSAFDNGADASKWMNKGINLYVATENGEMAVVASDEVADMTISFQSGKETEYTLGFDNLRGETFELRDVITGATIQMAEDVTYMFTQEPNTTIPARFQIIGAKKVITGMENIEEGANVQQKVMKNGVLYILRDNKWYNAQGQLMK